MPRIRQYRCTVSCVEQFDRKCSTGHAGDGGITQQMATRSHSRVADTDPQCGMKASSCSRASSASARPRSAASYVRDTHVKIEVSNARSSRRVLATMQQRVRTRLPSPLIRRACHVATLEYRAASDIPPLHRSARPAALPCAAPPRERRAGAARASGSFCWRQNLPSTAPAEPPTLLLPASVGARAALQSRCCTKLQLAQRGDQTLLLHEHQFVQPSLVQLISQTVP